MDQNKAEAYSSWVQEMLFSCFKSVTRWKSQQRVIGYIRIENIAVTYEMEGEGIKKNEKQKNEARF